MWSFDWVENSLAQMSVAELTSVVIIASAAALFVVLERIFPYNKGQEVLREGFFDDFALYTIAQSYILGVVIFSLIINSLDNWTGMSRLKLLSRFSLTAQLVFFTITHDFYIYWMHRWQHSNRFLWRIHEAHHSPRRVDWLSGSRSHALEILINQTVEFAPIVLLGASPEVVSYKGVISAVWGMYIHSNVNVRAGWLQHIINGPEMHRLHHTPSKGRNRNFSTKLAIWDWLFGTAWLPSEKAQEYGLKTFVPEGYLRQFVFAFRSFGKTRSASQQNATAGS